MESRKTDDFCALLHLPVVDELIGAFCATRSVEKLLREAKAYASVDGGVEVQYDDVNGITYRGKIRAKTYEYQD